MPTPTAGLVVHPDRLLPVDPSVRGLARTLYEAVRDLPLVSPHGHVDPRMLLDDVPFADPAALFVTPDHYVTRLLHASGVPLEDLGVGQGPLDEAAARRAWRLLCTHWSVFRGTPVRYWLESELAELFDVTVRPSAETADAIYDQIASRLATPEYRPRALFDRFRLDVLATTDDPCDDLAVHDALAADPTFGGRVIPTFRPDRYLESAEPGWAEAVRRLGSVADVDTGTYAGWVTAMEVRRRYFVEHGARSADHAHVDAGTYPLQPLEAERIYAAALAGTATADESVALRRHMLLEMARMACDDGLTMTLHTGVLRGHHTASKLRFGPDTGHDIPLRGDFTEPLRPLLERFGTHPNLNLVLFTLDETVFSRELAPLAGFYPAVYVGAPWWFLDAPDSIRRWRSAITETIGFSRTAGFIDDTRAFCSIPARHDMSRRLDAGFLAQLVAEHRLEEDEAMDTAIDLVAGRAREVFKAVSELVRRDPAPPVRHVHLGLGNFFRAHQAWYTAHASDGGDWGIAAFTGRSPDLARALAAQDGLYTLVTRGPERDEFEVVPAVARAHAADEHEVWLGHLADPAVQVVTTTVTEAGYVRDAAGEPDVGRPELAADLATLRRDPTAPVRTAPARLVAGLLARRRADAGPLTVVPCDNLPDNGAAVARVLLGLAERVDPALRSWIEESVGFATTMVDRITPEPTAADVAAVAAGTGVQDRAPVVTEPFSEWVLSGRFAADRPAWQDAGATFTTDVAPFEQRKLWLLNGAHSMLAYAASLRGHVTVADAMRDEVCRAWIEEWWDAASPHLTLPAADVAAYRTALTDRFANPRMAHRLDQIAFDGSQKLPIRTVPVLRLEVAAGRMPVGAVRPLAAWVCHLRGHGAAVTDARLEELSPLVGGTLRDAVQRVLGVLAADLAAHGTVVDAVVDQAQELESVAVA